jgi:hypothetical protein
MIYAEVRHRDIWAWFAIAGIVGGSWPIVSASVQPPFAWSYSWLCWMTVSGVLYGGLIAVNRQLSRGRSIRIEFSDSSISFPVPKPWLPLMIMGALVVSIGGVAIMLNVAVHSWFMMIAPLFGLATAWGLLWHEGVRTTRQTVDCDSIRALNITTRRPRLRFIELVLNDNRTLVLPPFRNVGRVVEEIRARCGGTKVSEEQKSQEDLSDSQGER